MGAGGVWAEEWPLEEWLLEWTESEVEEWAEEVTVGTRSGGDELGSGWGIFDSGV